MRSPEDLKTAAEAMFRMRAVESPPDADGARRIWHRGSRGAELVTVVDAKGRVVHQDFRLFDDRAQWSRDGGLSCSAVERPVPEAPEADGDGAARRVRLRLAMESYAGSDRFLQHLKERLAATPDAPATSEDPAASTPSERPALPDGPEEPQAPAARHTGSMLTAATFAALLIAALAFIALRWG